MSAITEKQQRAMNLYGALMEEAKVRLKAINSVLAGQSALPTQIEREFCYLQLRMLCEVIALGCLVAHGDITEANTKRLREEYRAGKIVEALADLHPAFYPEPAEPVGSSPGHFNYKELADGYLKRDDLIRLNGICGDVLHRGSVEKLITPKAATDGSLSDVTEWGNKVSLLLGIHRVCLIDRKSIILCQMRVRGRSNVQVAFAHAMNGEGEID